MDKKETSNWKNTLYKIIFEADTPLGKAFDVNLIFFITLSTLIVMAESVDSIRYAYGPYLHLLEWIVVIAFTLEYFLRIISVHNKWKYMISFYGLVDLFTILPAFISLLIPSAYFLITVRVLRLLRLFRVFKMARYVNESGVLLRALRASKPKITVFLFALFFTVTIIGSLMYIVEGPINGFDSIPESMYWAITTITTVGYGDLVPQTPTGKFLASTLMIMAYGILAVPTGIITFELAQANKSPVTTRVCAHCSLEGHDPEADFCSKCGEKLL